MQRFTDWVQCELLREVIAIHVISTILERSLILDDDSLRRVEKHLNDSFPRPSAANCVQRQIKFALFLAQRERVSQVLEDWGHMMWSSSKGMNVEQKWATSFSVLVMLILVVDKMIEAADLFCRGEVQHHGADALAERRSFEELVRLTQRELFERCKEIFHSSFKTRKGGKEACNPIRDGLSAFRGRPVPEGISRLVWDLKNAHRVYGKYRLSSRPERRRGRGCRDRNYKADADGLGQDQRSGRNGRRGRASKARSMATRGGWRRCSWGT